MKHIKSFRISEENISMIKKYSKDQDRSEGWVINKALDHFFQIKCYRVEHRPHK